MENTESLFWDEGANRWEDAIPVGNGYLGAMVYGHTSRDRIQLNEDSLWNGQGFDRINPKALEHLPEIRKLVLARKFKEAEELMFSYMISSPPSMTNYSTLGEIDLALNQEAAFPMGWFPESDCEKYSSELDLMKGILNITHEEKGVTYRREVFASYKRRVLCIHFESGKDRSVKLDIAINRYPYRDVRVPDCRRPGKFVSAGVWASPRCDRIYTEGKRLYMEGNEAGTKFAAALMVETDGVVEDCYSRLSVHDAGQVSIYLAALTSNRSENYRQMIDEQLDAVKAMDYESIKNEHIADFSSFMTRCVLRIDEDPESSRYFNYARYLMVSSSRPGSNAMNLQGIWNYEFTPSWDSKHTININQQMNYWPAEVCNLSELHEPQFDLISRLEKKGEECAEKMYGCRGIACHHNTDFYGDCGTQDVYPAATFWVTGGAWMAMHLWEHYRYTLDKDFLREKYPLMRKFALFFVDYLIEDDKGYLVTCPSVSPENRFITEEGYDTPICAGPAMDNQIIRAIMRACLEASKILETDEPLKADFERIISRLKPDGVDSAGRLKEWAEEEKELTPGMSHISHLWAVYPGEEITEKNPELFEAAKRSLESRLENGATTHEWPGAWQTALFARFKDSENVEKAIRAMLSGSMSKSLLNGEMVFQIDGNMGLLAGMAECLLQSHDGISLLPAVPRGWKNGEVKGLKARGNITVDISWKDAHIYEAVVCSQSGGKAFFNGNPPKKILSECGELSIDKREKGFEISLPANETVKFFY